MEAIELAKTYIGKKEKSANSGFEDPTFEADMRKYGEWIPPYPWCACFMQMVFRKAYPDKSEDLRKLFDPSTRATFINFQKAGYTISQTPFEGALVIWALYSGGVRDPQGRGHAGLVVELLGGDKFASIEGNGSTAGSRNGDRVVEHDRDTKVKPSGLNVLGFIKVV